MDKWVFLPEDIERLRHELKLETWQLGKLADIMNDVAKRK